METPKLYTFKNPIPVSPQTIAELERWLAAYTADGTHDPVARQFIDFLKGDRIPFCEPMQRAHREREERAHGN